MMDKLITDDEWRMLSAETRGKIMTYVNRRDNLIMAVNNFLEGFDIDDKISAKQYFDCLRKCLEICQ